MTAPNIILDQYDFVPFVKIEALGSAGGFSGASLWKVHTNEGLVCLRQWPAPHPSPENLSWIHRVLTRARIEGCSFVAAPIRNRAGESFTRDRESLWEVSRWMPGTANFLIDPNDERLVDMVQSLAKFHLASAQVNLDFRPSANLCSRLEQLRKLPRLAEQIVAAKWPPPTMGTNQHLVESVNGLRQLISSLILPMAESVCMNLQRYEAQIFPVQPVIRDIWHDHVLFSGNKVTGFVDFGAMQIDNVAFDLSRLLGTTIGNDNQKWETAINIYSRLRPLSHSEIELLPWLDRSGIILGGIHWLKWILLDQREFENWDLVVARIQYLRDRMAGLLP